MKVLQCHMTATLHYYHKTICSRTLRATSNENTTILNHSHINTRKQFTAAFR